MTVIRVNNEPDLAIPMVFEDQPIQLPSFTIQDIMITANGHQAQLFAGNYYCDISEDIEMKGTIINANGEVAVEINMPVTLKMPLVRHANGEPTTDEIYMKVTLVSGVITATGKISQSGDWKILIERVNQALLRIGAAFRFEAKNITFLV